MTTVAYSIGTLVTKPQQYVEMRRSFEARGFTSDDCEYLQIDNTAPPQTGAYAGLNRLLNAAKAARVILCHQDVLLIGDGRKELDDRLGELDRIDPAWAIAANAGGAFTRRVFRRITDKHGPDQRVGTFPHRVMSVDENFMVVRRDARIGFSHDLDGFHLYGADICLNADVAGHTAYVIDFHLNHLGAAVMGAAYDNVETAFRAKWQRALRDRPLQAPCSYMLLSGQRWPRMLTKAREIGRLRAARLGISLKKRLGQPVDPD
jgi:hypothetical protein